MMQRNAAIGIANQYETLDSTDRLRVRTMLDQVSGDTEADSLARAGARQALSAIDHADARDHEDERHPGDQPD